MCISGFGVPALQTSTPVVIFGSDSCQILGAVRSLGRLGVPVYCIDTNESGIAARSRFCRGVFSVDFNRVSEVDLVAALAEIGKVFKQRPLLLPTFDPIAFFIDRNRHRLTRWFILPDAHPGSAALLHNKESLQQLAAGSSKIRMPGSRFPDSPASFLSAANDVGFPLYLKAKDPTAFMSVNRCRLFYIENRAALGSTLESLSPESIENLFIQELAGGREGVSLVVAAYVAKQGGCPFMLAGRKERQLPTFGGTTSRGSYVDLPVARDLVIELSRLSGYRGIIDLDLRLDPSSGEMILLDVNPRLGANFRLMTDKNGLDALRACYLDLTGQKVPSIVPDHKRTWMSEEIDFDALRGMGMRRSVAFLHWSFDLVRTSEKAYLSWSDPWPSLIFLCRFARRISGNLLRRTVGRIHTR